MKDNPGMLLTMMMCCVYPLLMFAGGYALGWRKWAPRIADRWRHLWDR